MGKASLLALIIVMLFSNVASADDFGDFCKSINDGDLPKVRAILAKNPQLVHSMDDKGNTALMVAAGWGKREIVELLISGGAHVNAKNSDGYTALMLAVAQGHSEIVKYLAARGADVNARTGDNWTALMCAASFGHYEMTRYLVSLGADINIADADGVTPLMRAAQQSHNSVVELLLSKGADLDARDKNKRSAIMYAAIAGHRITVEHLILKGADVNVRDNEGRTALMLAALRNHNSTVKALISAGADVNARDNDGATALIYAARAGKKSTVELLISGGADREAKDRNGRTALMEAKETGHDDLSGLLSGSVTYTFLPAAAANSGQKPVIECEIKSNKSAYSLNEDILIEVKIVNRGMKKERATDWKSNMISDQEICTIYSIFEDEDSYDSSTLPYAPLSFLILDEKGRKMIFRGIDSRPLCVIYAYPDDRDFIDLSPDGFFGRVINLTSGPYSYFIDKPGEYQVQATYANNTRAWLEEIRKTRPDVYSRYSFRLPESCWWDGEMRSNVIGFKVEPLK